MNGLRLLLCCVGLAGLVSCLDLPDMRGFPCGTTQDCLGGLVCTKKQCTSLYGPDDERTTPRDGGGRPDQNQTREQPTPDNKPPDPAANCPQTGKDCVITGCKKFTTYQCIEGKEICVPDSMELCRDQEDNDCDGQVDEICGNSYPRTRAYYGSASSSRTKDITVKAGKENGFYILTSPNAPCDKHPLFLSMENSVSYPMRYACAGSEYNVYLGGSMNENTLRGGSFHAVIPTKTPGELWGVVDTQSCTSSTCKVQSNYGAYNVFKGSSDGVYIIKAPACTHPYQPILVTVYDAAIFGYVSARSNINGNCEIRLGNLAGQPSSRLRFAFWLPNRETNAWAVASNTGKLYASNTFGDQQARWSAKDDGYEREVFLSFPAWNKTSLALISSRVEGAHFSVTSSTSSKVRLYAHIYPGKTIKERIFTVLFIQ